MVKDPQDYWNKRYSKQGAETVGFAGYNLREQDEQYLKVQEFLNPYIASGLPYGFILADYGCGIGRHSQLFNNEYYYGFDLSLAALNIASKNNPEHNYYHVDEFFLCDDNYYDVLFTATVLQHNADSEVKRIFSRAIERGMRIFFIYENSCGKDAPHMKSRTSEDYLSFIDSIHEPFIADEASHVIHGEEHTLTVIYI